MIWVEKAVDQGTFQDDVSPNNYVTCEVYNMLAKPSPSPSATPTTPSGTTISVKQPTTKLPNTGVGLVESDLASRFSAGLGLLALIAAATAAVTRREVDQETVQYLAHHNHSSRQRARANRALVRLRCLHHYVTRRG